MMDPKQIKAPMPGGDINGAMRMAQDLLRNAQRPNLRVLAVVKEIDTLNAELERSHESYRKELQFRQNAYDSEKRINTLNASLQRAISRYHDLAEESENAKTQNPTEKCNLHAADGQKPPVA